MRPELLADAVDEQLDAPATTAHVDVKALPIHEEFAQVAQRGSVVRCRSRLGAGATNGPPALLLMSLLCQEIDG